MKRNLLLALIALSALFFIPGANAADAPPKPNVLWIYLEDVSGWFSCYGEELIETPNIDALAADGIRFDRFYTPAGVCSATRSGQILGTMQTTFGVHQHRSSRNIAAGTKHDGVGMIHLPEGVKTLPGLFRAGGYFAYNSGAKDDYNFVWSAEDLYDFPGEFGRGKGWGLTGGGDEPLWHHAPEGRPWFGQIQLKGGKLGGQAPTVIDRASVPVPPYYPDIDLVREEIAHHYDCILETDRQVGEIIAALKEEGLYGKTYIFLHSDHGYKLHRHKQFLYQGGIHMPLIVTGPGIAPGQVREDLISGIDLAPASLAAAGLPVPEWMEGRDFLAKDYTPRDFIVAARDRCDYTIERIRTIVTPKFQYLKNYLTGRPYMQPSYKDPWPVSQKFREMMANGEMNETQLIFFGDTKPEEELYDLENDPHQIHNLAGDPAYRDALEKHRQLLSGWIQETGGGGLEPEPDSGLIQVLYQWGDRCVNPEYDALRDQIEPLPKKGKGKE